MIVGLSCTVSSERAQLPASKSQIYYTRLHIRSGGVAAVHQDPGREKTFSSTLMVVLDLITVAVARFSSKMQRLSYYQVTRMISTFVNLLRLGAVHLTHSLNYS